MFQFLFELRTLASELCNDHHFVEDEISRIKSTAVDIAGTSERLLKILWTFYNYRTHLLFNRQANGNRLSFVKGKSLGETPPGSFLNLLKALPKDPFILAHVIHFTRSEIFIVERLCFLAYSTFGNFCLTRKNADYLNSLTDCLLHLSSNATHTAYSPVDNLTFVCVYKVFYANLSDVRRFLATLLQDLASEISWICDSSGSTSNLVCYSPTSHDELYSFLCGSGENYPTGQVYSLVNKLIACFKKNANLFPGSLLLFLGKYRRHLNLINTPIELRRLLSVELIVDLFIIQAMLHPFSYGACLKQNLEPRGHFIWLQIASAFRYLAHIPQYQPTASDGAQTEADVFLRKLVERCDAQSLHSTLQQIMESADLTFSKYWKDIKPSSLRSVDDPPHSDAFASELPDFILVTASDLNILLDCLRLLRSAEPELTTALNEALDSLPSRVPGSSFGVRQVPFTTSAPEQTTGSGVNANCAFRLVQYDPEIDCKPGVRDKSLKASTYVERSHSAGRLIGRSSVRNKSIPSTQNQSASLDHVECVLLGQDSPGLLTDAPSQPNEELVYIISLNDYQRSVQSHLLSETEFMKSFKQKGISTNQRSLAGCTMETCAHPTHNPPHISERSNITQASSLVSQSQSSGELSAEDGMGYRRLGEQSGDNVQEHLTVPTGDEPVSHSKPRALGVTFPPDVLDTSDPTNDDLVLSEDRSNDPSSDLSDRSGFTSLASSAHALGRRMRFIPKPVGCDRASDEEQPNAQADTSPTDAPAPSVISHAAEKHARFSVSAFPARVQSNQSCGADALVEHLGFDPVLGTQDTDFTAPLRTHLARTGSVEWSRISATESFTSYCNSNPFDLDQHNSTNIVASHTSPNPLHRSSLNCLQTCSFEASVNESTRVNRQESDQLADIPDRDERLSTHTCSSCGVRLERIDLGDHATTTSNFDYGSHANLDVSRVNEEDEVLSDLPLSSANVSGRVTPLSVTSSTSRGAAGPSGTQLLSEQSDCRGAGYARVGFVLPNGTVSSAIIHGTESPDVTDKFGKFELPAGRPPEVETRSTISDTWSTDVLPSDTEYADLGSDLPNSEPNTSNNSNVRKHRSHRHRDQPSINVRRSNNSHAVIQSKVRSHTDEFQSDYVRSSNNDDLHRSTLTESNTGFPSANVTRNSEICVSNSATLRANTNANAELQVVRVAAPDLLYPGSSSSANALHVTLPDDSPNKLTSPSATPLGTDRSGDASLQTAGPYTVGPSVSCVNDAVRAITEDSSKPRGITHVRHRLSMRNSCVNQTSRFPWPPNDSPVGLGNRVMETDFQQKALRAQFNRQTHFRTSFKDSAGFMRRSASFTSTASSLSLNVELEFSATEAVNTSQTGEARSLASLTKSSGEKTTAAESVEQMMDRYRRQSAVTNRSPREFERAKEERHSTCGSIKPSCHPMLEQVKYGLREIFSHPLVGPVVGEIVDKVATQSCIDLSGVPNMTCEPKNNSVDQDEMFLSILEVLLSEYLNFQDVRLTTKLKEIGRLFHLLMGSTMASGESVTGAPPSDAGRTESQPHAKQSVIARLIKNLREDRKKRKPYFAYLLSIRSRLSQTLRYLKFLSICWERVLQLQCEDITFNTVVALIDSQADSVNEFLEHFADNRARYETDDGTDPALQLVRCFVDRLVKQWDEKFPDPHLIYKIPLNDTDLSAIVSLSKPPRSHIERLVLETLYRSGVWMYDAKVERQCDRLLFREISLFKNSISMSSLRIPPAFQTLYPFASIQDELKLFDSSHVPSDMIACLKRVIERIIATLSIASPDITPNADDILPVLIFVLIQVNPPRLLTNSTFFEVFHESLSGEDQYVWCQFRSAISEVRRLISPLPPREDQFV